MLHVDVPDIIVVVFAYLHIISAMAWLGGALLFTSALAPSTSRLSRLARLEFLATAIPRLTIYFFAAATSAIVFGFALFITIPDFSQYLYVGMATAAAAYVLIVTEIPVFTRIGDRARALGAEGSTSSLAADLAKDMKRGRISTVTTVLLLAVTLMFMVYSGFGP